MRVRRSAICIGCLLLMACGGGSWIHPTKPQDEFAQDWNKCENDVLKDPKLQQGQRYLTLQATERCVKRKGWQIKSEE